MMSDDLLFTIHNPFPIEQQSEERNTTTTWKTNKLTWCESHETEEETLGLNLQEEHFASSFQHSVNMHIYFIPSRNRLQEV